MMPFHPAADLFPLMNDADLAVLADDIRTQGQRVSIVTHEGQILDGRNRARACELAQIAPKTVPWNGAGGSPTLYVLSINLHRRHLSESQRAMVAASALPLLEAEAAERQKAAGAQGVLGSDYGQDGGRGNKKAETPCGPTGPQGVSRAYAPAAPSKPARKEAQRSSKVAATATNASDRSVRRAKYVAEKAPELAQKVRDGEVTLGAAEHAVRTAEKAATVAVQVAVATVVDVQLEVADATEPWPVEPGSIDLIFTSPPYGLDKPYHGITDSAAAWPAFMQDWLRQAFTVAADTGRLALNVPLDTTKGAYRPTWPEACAAAVAAGWAYRTCIVWTKGNSTKGNRGLGSENSADAPHPIAEVEMIGLFYKGAWKKQPPRPSDIRPEDWQAWGDGVWQLTGETRPWEGHPAPFSEELARRILLYFSRVGDVVMDPFSGSGTTVLVARRLKRVPLGMDQSAEYIASAQRRLARESEKSGDQTSAEEQLSFDVLAGASERVDHQ